MCYLKALSRFFGCLSNISGYIAVVLMGSAVILVMMEVIRRAIFHSSFLWTFEISAWLVVGVVYMGLSYALKTGGHVRVTLITARLSPRVQHLLQIPLAAIGSGLMAYLATYVFQRMLLNITRHVTGMSVIEPPLFTIYLVAFIGLCIFVLQFIGVIFDSIIFLKEGESQPN